MIKPIKKHIIKQVAKSKLLPISLAQPIIMHELL